MNFTVVKFFHLSLHRGHIEKKIVVTNINTSRKNASIHYAYSRKVKTFFYIVRTTIMTSARFLSNFPHQRAL